MFVANDIVTLTSPTGLEFGVLNAIWEKGFISQSELRSQAQSGYTYEKI